MTVHQVNVVSDGAAFIGSLGGLEKALAVEPNRSGECDCSEQGCVDGELWSHDCDEDCDGRPLGDCNCDCHKAPD